MSGDASSSFISSSSLNISGIATLKTAYVPVLSAVSAAVTVATAAMATISMTTAAVATSPMVASTVKIKAEKSFALTKAAFTKQYNDDSSLSLFTVVCFFTNKTVQK